MPSTKCKDSCYSLYVDLAVTPPNKLIHGLYYGATRVSRCCKSLAIRMDRTQLFAVDVFHKCCTSVPTMMDKMHAINFAHPSAFVHVSFKMG
jgi:hypothetical protein